jgi:hypothetical protein
MTDTTANIPDDANDPVANATAAKQTITNDAVAGETVIDNGHYAGPNGSEPLEGQPDLPDNELAGDDIDLRDSE